MQPAGDDFVTSAVEIIPGRFSFVWIKRADSLRTSAAAAAGICFCVDDELQYMPFYGDFGPLNLGQAYRFCRKTIDLLQEAERRKCKLFCYTGPQPNFKANSAVLVGLYQVIFMHKSAEDAFKPLMGFKPYAPFRDASCGVSSFHLTVLDCMKGIQKARDVGFIDWNSGRSTFNLDDYELYEQVEQGDMNWILPGKLLAFSGPAVRGNEIPGYRLFTPEDYWDIFKRKGITTVVRLNKKSYDRKRFTDGGFKHVELYFPDGSNPIDAILFKFLELAEAEPGALAIHCKAGLGRTGVLICCYLMKHYRFTAEEVIGYIRICRPGSVIGPQQNYLREMEPRMWHEGDVQRAAQRNKGVNGAQDLAVSGQYAGQESSSPKGGYVRPLRGADAPSSVSSSMSDASLAQYKQQYGTVGSTSSSSATSVLAPATPSASVPTQPTRGRYGQRNVTPQRYGTSNVTGGYSSVSTFSSLLAQPPSIASSMYSAISRGSQVSKSYPAPPGRSPSADPRTAAASMRATLHTDTLRAAERARVLPERSSQSADMHSSSWAKPTASYSGPSTPPRSVQGVASPRTSASSSAITRGLAPNGQPRKVPGQLLGQYNAGAAAAAVGRPGSSQQGPSAETARARSVSLASMRNQLHSK